MTNVSYPFHIKSETFKIPRLQENSKLISPAKTQNFPRLRTDKESPQRIQFASNTTRDIRSTLSRVANAGRGSAMRIRVGLIRRDWLMKKRRNKKKNCSRERVSNAGRGFWNG